MVLYPNAKKVNDHVWFGQWRPNHGLRKRKPVLLTEEEMSSRFSTLKDKQCLKDIADKLNAVNKNTTLYRAF